MRPTVGIAVTSGVRIAGRVNHGRWSASSQMRRIPPQRWLQSLVFRLLPAGCFLPSHPAGPSVGLRIDQGKPVLYLPLCPGDRWSPRGSTIRAERAGRCGRGEQPAHPGDKEVSFGPSDWGRQTGSFSYDGQTFSIVRRRHGAVLRQRGGRTKGACRPAGGVDDLNGKVVTAAEIDHKSDREKSG